MNVTYLLPESAAEPDETATDGEAVPGGPDDEGMQFVVRAAVAAERARIAREMHDGVGKSLFGIATVAASLASQPRRLDPSSLDQQLRELTRLARQAVADTQGAITDLRDEPLAEAVRSVATGWGITAGVRVSLAVLSGSGATEEIRREIVCILREALHNVEQHAHASRVRVCLRMVATGRLFLTVADNGTGFRPPADLWELQSAACYGLIGIAERARRVGGALTIRSRPGRGTRIAVQVPVPATAGRLSRAVPSAPAVRVVIAEANPVLRARLHAVLEHAPGVEIVAEATTGHGAVEQVRRHRPDVLLLDVRMPLNDGLPTIPQIGQRTQVVMLTSVDDAVLITLGVAAGARGCAVRGEFDPSELIQIVRDTARLRSSSSRYSAAACADPAQDENGGAAWPPGGGLTPREREVMGLIAEGLSNRQIAARLVISEKTVKNHICNIYQRFGVYERSQAVSRWHELRLASLAAGPLAPGSPVVLASVGPRTGAVEARPSRQRDRGQC